ncbi:hypothetical protein [Ideonella livida]|uniref:Uncharacterized protein n=1 Tax=Ideonella livida TaxID=2707176 RepID=A0A7C9TJW0_9BURK|nr:hypothetical protein [Ideonella livida]NDY92018.1 hypothetical protein [Ideonella livida]
MPKLPVHPRHTPRYPSHDPARRCLAGLALAAACGLSGCGVIDSARIWFPQASGLEAVNPRLYVEPAMTAEQRQELQRQIEQGRAVVAAFYGELTSQPYVVACLTSACDHRFGSYGQPAAAYGDMAIRLSYRGRVAPLIAHEWSHAELYRRAGGWWHARQIPRWFDEGVAVVVADEPRHSEDNWRAIQGRGLPTPTLDELRSFSDWGTALRRYGETSGDVPDNLRRVYTTAGHEVRGFLRCTGPEGVQAVLDAVRAGATFDQAYSGARAACVD